jgi:hypothetical protein
LKYINNGLFSFDETKLRELGKLGDLISAAKEVEVLET